MFTPFMIASTLLAVAIAAVGAFAYWIRRQDSFNLDQKIKSWETFIKLLSALTIVTAGVFGFLKYIDQKSVELFQRQAESEQMRYDEMKKTFDDALATAGALAQMEKLSTKGAQQVLSNFEDLYWWKMVQHEDSAVESAMVRFRRALHEWQKSNGEKPGNMNQLLLSLSTAIRQQLTTQESRIEKLRNLATGGILDPMIAAP